METGFAGYLKWGRSLRVHNPVVLAATYTPKKMKVKIMKRLEFPNTQKKINIDPLKREVGEIIEREIRKKLKQ